MKLSIENSYEYAPQRVFAARVEPIVRERSCQESGAVSFEVKVDELRDGGARVSVTRVLRPTIPDAFKKFTGDTIEVDQVEEWGPAAADGTRRARINVLIKGQPASMVGTAVLSPSGSGSTEEVSGDVTVSIPIIGRMVEPQIVDVVGRALRMEQQAAADWIAGWQR